MAPTFLTGFVSVGLKNLTKYVPHFPRPCGLKQILTWVLGLDSSSKGPKQIFTSVPLSLWTRTNFDLGSLSLGLISLNFWVRFTQLHSTLHRICFPPPWEPNQICASFPSALCIQANVDLGSLSLACFLKFYWRSFRSASGHQHTYRIKFVSLGLLDQADSHHSALWTQTNFDLGSLSLGLVSQIVVVFVSLSLWTPTHI